MPSSMTIQVPKDALPDLKRIAEMDAALFDPFLHAIGEMQPTLTHGQFASKLAEKLPNMERSAIRSILGTALSLYAIMAKDGTPLLPQELAEGIATSSLITKSKDFTSETRKTLSSRLTKLLGFHKTLGVTSKAFDVMTEQERIYCHSRILSDIRPVFTENPETADGAVIIHNLQIAFHRCGEHEEIYIALDTNDLQQLKQVVERAEKKTAALQAMLKTSHVPYLEV